MDTIVASLVELGYTQEEAQEIIARKNTSVEPPVVAPDPVAMACALAHALAINGRRPDDASVKIRGGWNDYNAKGRGESVLRQVWRDGRWQWVAEGQYLPKGRFLAGDRKATIYGDVYPGEIIAEGYGPKYAPKYIVTSQEKPLVEIKGLKKKRNGTIVVTLPDDSEVTVASL